MGFFNKAKARANTFFSKVPSHLGKARTFLSGALATGKRAHQLVTHVRQGVESNDIFDEKVKEKSRKVGQFADLGLAKIETLHKGTDQFLGHLQQAPI